MSYRINEKRPPRKRRDAKALTTPGDIYVVNGTATRIAVPCFYHEIHPALPAVLHDRTVHDFIGWPSPDSPDRVCQERDFAIPTVPDHLPIPGHGKYAPAGPGELRRYIDMGALFPVHFNEEGYEKVTARVASSIKKYVKVKTSIDEERDWVIRLVVTVKNLIDEIEDKQKEEVGAYGVYASGPNGSIQCVVAGRIHVMPALYDETDE